MIKQLMVVTSKFVVTGVISTAINYSLFFVLFKTLGINYILASAIGYIFGLIVGFFLNNFWTFESSIANVKHIVKYVSVYLFSLCLSSLLLWILVDKYKFNAVLMNILVICVSTITNFLGLKCLIYKK